MLFLPAELRFSIFEKDRSLSFEGQNPQKGERLVTTASRMWSAQGRLDREAADPRTKQAARPGFRPLLPGVRLRCLWAPILLPPPHRSHTHTHACTSCKAPFWAEKVPSLSPLVTLSAVNSRVTGRLPLRLPVASDQHRPLPGPCRPQM